MELTKKTTILLSPDLHRKLSQLAERSGLSLGELVRRACEAQYGILAPGERLAAVRDLGTLRLPVADPAVMKRESVPDPDDLLP